MQWAINEGGEFDCQCPQEQLHSIVAMAHAAHMQCPLHRADPAPETWLCCWALGKDNFTNLRAIWVTRKYDVWRRGERNKYCIQVLGFELTVETQF